MSRKLFGLSGLALVVAAALAMVTPSAAKSGLTAVGDDVAVSVSGGQYCPYVYYYGNQGCGGYTPCGNCPYCPGIASGGTTPGIVLPSMCFNCGISCGSCNLISPCVMGTGS